MTLPGMLNLATPPDRIDDIIRRDRMLLEPPPNLTISQWADQRRYIPPEENPTEAGKWSTARAEYQRGMMDAFCDPRVHTVVLYTSGRVGKTSILENVIGYHVDMDPCPILGVQPTDQDGRDWSKDQISGLIRDTPVLADKVEESRAKRSDNTIAHKKFPGGYLKIVGANSPRGFRRTTIRVVLADEVDGYPPTAGPEGDPLELAKNRAMTVWNKKIGITSTPTVEGVSRIEAEWELSDKRHYFVACPHCGFEQVLVFWKRSKFAELSGGGYLAFDNVDGKAQNVRYVCGHCNAELHEQDKAQMVRTGIWRSTEPNRTGVAGFHISTLYSTFVTWREVAQAFLAAQDNQEKLRAFINVWLGEVWSDSESYTVTTEALLERVEPYTKVPAGVLVLTCAVDVQHDRFELKVKGWGLHEESWLIDYECIMGDPQSPVTWGLLDEYLAQTFEREDGVTMRVLTTFVDSGYLAPTVYEFTSARKHRRIYAVKGRGQWSALFTKPGRRSKSSERVITIGVSHAKEIIYPRLKNQNKGTAGYMHFNAKATAEYFRGLTAEKPVTVVTKSGSRRRVWLQMKNRANEPWDLEVYNFAAFKFSKVNLLQRQKEIAELASHVREKAADARPVGAAHQPAAQSSGEQQPRKPRRVKMIMGI